MFQNYIFTSLGVLVSSLSWGRSVGGGNELPPALAILLVLEQSVHVRVRACVCEEGERELTEDGGREGREEGERAN